MKGKVQSPGRHLGISPDAAGLSPGRQRSRATTPQLVTAEQTISVLPQGFQRQARAPAQVPFYARKARAANGSNALTAKRAADLARTDVAKVDVKTFAEEVHERALADRRWGRQGCRGVVAVRLAERVRQRVRERERHKQVPVLEPNH